MEFKRQNMINQMMGTSPYRLPVQFLQRAEAGVYEDTWKMHMGVIKISNTWF